MKHKALWLGLRVNHESRKIRLTQIVIEEEEEEEEDKRECLAGGCAAECVPSFTYRGLWSVLGADISTKSQVPTPKQNKACAGSDGHSD